MKKTKHTISGKLVKHRANADIQSAVERDTTFLVKSNTPFVSALKRINKMVEKFNKSVSSKTKYQGGNYRNLNFCVVKGMGKTIEKTLGLANQLSNDYKVEILTGSVEVVDEFVEDEDSQFQKRTVSYVELRIWLKRE